MLARACNAALSSPASTAASCRGARQQSLGTLQQAQQQVLHQYLAAATGYAALGRAFEVAPGVGIQRLNQLLQVYVDHAHPSLMNLAAQRHHAIGALRPSQLVQPRRQAFCAPMRNSRISSWRKTSRMS